MKFKIGDRVRVCSISEEDNIAIGECGTVVDVDPLFGVTYAVRFDTRDIVGKHDCGGLCKQVV